MTSDVWARRALDVKSIVFEVVFLHWGDGVSPETRHPKELGEERLAGSWGKGPSGPQGKASGHVVGSQPPPPRYSCQTCSEAPELPVSVAGSWALTAKRLGQASWQAPRVHRSRAAWARETAASSSACRQG